MRRTVVAALAALFLGAATADADGPLKLQSVPLEVERGTFGHADERVGGFEVLVDSLNPSGEQTLAKVTIRNVSAIELEEIELVCSAFDGADRELATASWRLAEEKWGPLTRGGSMTFEVPLAARASEIRSATCNAKGY